MSFTDSQTSTETTETMAAVLPYDNIAEQAFGPIAVFDEDICWGWDGIPPKRQVIPELEQPELEQPELEQPELERPEFPPALLMRSTNMPPPPPRLMRAESVMHRPSLAMRSNSETPAIYKKIINDITEIITEIIQQPESTDLPSDYFDTPPPAPPKLVRHATESAYIN